MFEEIFITIEAKDNLGTGNLNTTELYLKVLDINGKLIWIIIHF